MPDGLSEIAFPVSDSESRTELPYELQDGSHVCWVEADPDDGTPAHYRPCPADLCQAAHLHNLLVEVSEELRQRRACLEGARDDLARIAGASVEDGGVWIKAVAESRLPLIDAAISETDKSLVVLGSFNVGL